ncbi:MAG: hypothetical protein QM775_13680 [Pirellulales bacterium]
MSPSRTIRALVAAVLLISCDAARADDGTRAVDVPRFGVKVRVPQAWSLIDWARDDTAFVVQLPQDARSVAGEVACRMSPGGGDLQALKKQVEAEAEAAKSGEAAQDAVRRKRTLAKCEITELKTPAVPEDFAKRFQSRLTADWTFVDAKERPYFERFVYLQGGDLRYTFSMSSDESHYDSFIIDFEEMIAKAQLKPLELAVERLPSGHWLQRDYRFGLQLPEGWRPNFGGSERVLFFATGAANGVFNDNLAVQASPSLPLDLKQLATELPELVRKKDPSAEASARIVPQGGREAVETITHTSRGGLPIVVLERRFATPRRNYELRLSCAAATFDKREKELRAALDSFIELEPKGATANET